MTSVRAARTWTANAEQTFREFSEADHDLGPLTFNALYEACELISHADKMQMVVDADGLVVEGSQGQPVAHPLVAEVRQYRRAALDAIRSLGSVRRSSASAAASALANKRWSNRPSGSISALRHTSTGWRADLN